jgi:hypothetical protein
LSPCSPCSSGPRVPHGLTSAKTIASDLIGHISKAQEQQWQSGNSHRLARPWPARPWLLASRPARSIGSRPVPPPSPGVRMPRRLLGHFVSIGGLGWKTAGQAHKTTNPGSRAHFRRQSASASAELCHRALVMKSNSSVTLPPGRGGASCTKA